MSEQLKARKKLIMRLHCFVSTKSEHQSKSYVLSRSLKQVHVTASTAGKDGILLILLESAKGLVVLQPQ